MRLSLPYRLRNTPVPFRYCPLNTRNHQIRAYAINTPSRAYNHDPLRVLFCGSDLFSIYSLKALHQEAQRPDTVVASIDVVCRPGKPVQRGLKSIRHPPIKATADELGLSIHQIDTFTGWNPPRYPETIVPDINLIIAVSFGLLVPARILKAAKYGGINLHPSILPDLRGPAPLRWIMIEGETRTGVTLQTLHPTKFDHGMILDQTLYPGIEIPNLSTYNYEDLVDLSGKMGADMLIKALRNGSFVSPQENVKRPSYANKQSLARHAPKINRATRFVDFRSMDSSRIMRLNRAVPPLWSKISTETGELDIIFDGDISIIQPQRRTVGDVRDGLFLEPGRPYVLLKKEESLITAQVPLLINTIDGATLGIPKLKLPGTSSQPAAQILWRKKLLTRIHRSDGQTLFSLPVIPSATQPGKG